MLMVTKIIDLNKETVTTEFKVTEDCIFVKDNKFTESGIIENAAQSCSAIVGQDLLEVLKGQAFFYCPEQVTP